MTPAEELKIAEENLAAINLAIKNFLSGNAIVEYFLNTGQTTTKVTKSSMKDLLLAKKQFQSEVSELEQIVSSSNLIMVRDF